MTIEEAIKIVEGEYVTMSKWYGTSEEAGRHNEAIKMAIDALRKQIPMRMPGTYTNYKCAVCGRRIRSGKGSSSFSRDNFCQRCGQAVDWSEST